MMPIDMGGAGTTVAVVVVVFALYLVRAWGVAPFATILALDYGANAFGVLVLRGLSDLLIAGGLFWAVGRWRATHTGHEPGRIGRWLARLRNTVERGSVFVNTLTAGYFLNTYLVFGLIPTLPPGRRSGALAGALAGDLASFVLDLAAILGLSMLVGGSRTGLSIGMTALALLMAAANHLLQRRLRPAQA
jgi:hypothetical protein